MNDKALVAILLFALLPTAHSLPIYTLQELRIENSTQSSVAISINNLGQVIGQTENRAFTWSQAMGYRELALFDDYLSSSVRSINDFGYIAGLANNSRGNTAVLWDPHGGVRSLGALEGSAFSTANAINNMGQVVGRSGQWGFLWTESDGMRQLPTPDGALRSEAVGINNRGQIIGYAEFDGGRANQGLLWDADGSMSLLSVEGTSFFVPTAINDLGFITGDADVPLGSFLRAPSGDAQWLGPFEDKWIWALDINNHNQIAGSKAHLAGPALMIEDGTNHLLADRIQNFDREYWARLNNAVGINDAGQIVGTGTSLSGFRSAFILTPVSVPEPSTVWLIALGLIGLAFRGALMGKRPRRYSFGHQP